MMSGLPFEENEAVGLGTLPPSQVHVEEPTMQQAFELIRTTRPSPLVLSPPSLNATKSGRIALESQALLALSFTQHGADSLPEAHAKLQYLNKELNRH